MKKLFTLISCFLLTFTASAQEFVFTDLAGNVLENGALITRTEPTDDGFGGIELSGGIAVKNVEAPDGCQVSIAATITKIDNGSLQLCFPTNCQVYSATGTFEPNEKATLAAGETKTIQTEWLPTAYGECSVTYTAKAHQGIASHECRTVTVNYKYVATQQNWWGYVTDDTEKTTVGTSTAEIYDCAIFIPGDHPIAAGKAIKAIRFGLTATNAKDAKVWVAASLPATVSANNTLQLVDVADEQLGKENIDIQLPSPVTIPAEGVYVGYSFTISKVADDTDRYPVLCTGTDMLDGLLLKSSTSLPQWSNLNGYGFGSLFLQVLLEGQFADNTASPYDFGPVYVALGETASATVSLMNVGITPVSSIDYTISSDGVTSAEQHADIDKPIGFNTEGAFQVTVSADDVAGEKDKLLNITKVNGLPNANAGVAASFTVYTLSEIIARNVLVEEFTGTGCGWCPRGLVGMDKLRNTFGDRFIGIGLHQYNSSDAMYIASASYAPVSFSGAPSCRLDRKDAIDPYYGSKMSNGSILDDFAAEMAIPALAKVSVSGTADSDLKKVEAKAVVEPLFDVNGYTLEFVVIGDGLKGTGSAWNQANYYYKYTSNELPGDLAIFASGGKFGKSSITGWTFNDVALCSSYALGANQVSALGPIACGEKKEVTYKLTMPTKTTLRNAIQSDQLFIIAIVVDKNKQIVNAAKQKIDVAAPTGIQTVSTADADAEDYYTIDGKRLSAPVRGLNVVRLSDGTTRKIVIK